jgi:hypothetical protein
MKSSVDTGSTRQPRKPKMRNTLARGYCKSETLSLDLPCGRGNPHATIERGVHRMRARGTEQERKTRRWPAPRPTREEKLHNQERDQETSGGYGRRKQISRRGKSRRDPDTGPKSNTDGEKSPRSSITERKDWNIKK